MDREKGLITTHMPESLQVDYVTLNGEVVCNVVAVDDREGWVEILLIHGDLVGAPERARIYGRVEIHWLEWE